MLLAMRLRDGADRVDAHAERAVGGDDAESLHRGFGIAGSVRFEFGDQVRGCAHSV